MPNTPYKFRTFTRFVAAICIVVLLLLTGFESIPLATDNATYLYQTELQLARSQVITKSILILAYRPAEEHPQAIADMQASLPLLQQEQTILASYNEPDVQLLLQSARPNYLAIVNAAQATLNHPTQPVDPVWLDIIVAKNSVYQTTMNQVTVAIKLHIQNQTVVLFLIKCGMIASLLLLGVGYWVVFEWRVRQVIAEEQGEASKGK